MSWMVENASDTAAEKHIAQIRAILQERALKL